MVNKSYVIIALKMRKIYTVCMANGEEDLREKNKDKKPLSENYDSWRVFQGREDAEMLQEKSVNWKNKKSFREYYDQFDYD